MNYDFCRVNTGSTSEASGEAERRQNKGRWYRIKSRGATLYFQLPDPDHDQRSAKDKEKTPKQIARAAMGSDARLFPLSMKPEKMLYSGRTVYGLALMMDGEL